MLLATNIKMILSKGRFNNLKTKCDLGDSLQNESYKILEDYIIYSQVYKIDTRVIEDDTRVIEDDPIDLQIVLIFKRYINNAMKFIRDNDRVGKLIRSDGYPIL